MSMYSPFQIWATTFAGTGGIPSPSTNGPAAVSPSAPKTATGPVEGVAGCNGWSPAESGGPHTKLSSVGPAQYLDG